MNIAHELFLLMFKLSQLHDKVKIIELFIEGICEAFKPIVFFYVPKDATPNSLHFEIKTKKSSFGYICIKKTKSISQENEILLKNCLQMLAVILERLDLESQLNKEKNPGEQLAEAGFIELQETISELTKAKTATLNLIANLNKEIEKRAEAENKLLYNNYLMSYIIENDPSAISVLDKDLRYLYVSKRFIKDYKINETDIIGKRHYDIFPELPERWKEIHRKSLAGEILNSDDDKFLRADGTVDYVRWECRPWYESVGTIGGIILFTEVITGQKLLQQKQLHLLDIIDNSLNEIYIYDSTTLKFEYLNHGALLNLGYTLDEIKNLTPVDIEPEFTLEKFKQTVEPLVRDEVKQLHLETIHQRKDGSTYPVEIRMQLFEQNDKKVFLAIINDITERIIAEEALTISEKKYRYMFENNPQPMWIYDIETLKFLEVNTSAINQYGYTRDEFLSMTLRDIRPLEDIPLLELDIAQTDKKLNSAGEWRHKKKNGELIHVEIISHAVIYNNHPARHVLIRDITQHKRAEMIQTIQYNIANAVINSKDLEQLFNSIKFELNHLIYAKNFFIAFYNEETGMLSSFVNVDEKDEISEWSADKSLTGYVIRKNEPIILRKDDILRLHENGIIDLIGTTSEAWLGVPLMIEGKVLGAIVVQSYDNPDAYDKSSIEILELIAHELSIYIERQRAEENVVKLSKAVEQSPVSVIITDPKGNIEYVNSKFIMITGYSLEEVKGKNPRILQSGEKTAEDYSKLWSAILSGVEWRGEFHNKKKNGELFWENAVISPLLNQRGKVTHFIAVNEDITEKKLTLERILKSEEQFRSTWENSFDGMRLTDSNGIIVEVNEAYCKLVKKDRSELLGKNLLSVYLKQDEKAPERYKERFNSGHIETKLETKVVLWNGEEKWISLSNSFIQTGKEKKLLLSILRDISAQKEYESELMIAKDKAEEMSRVKSNFLANMSHELRTPLVAILGYSEFLKEELTSNSELTPMIDNIMKGGNRLLETVNLILNFSQSESGKKELSVDKMNIIPLLKESFNLFIPLAANAKLEYNFKSSNEEINCQIDERLFREVISNLINNAVKFTESGAVTLSVESINQMAVIKIIDTGIGIPLDKQAVIWEEFRQVSEGLSRSFEGTGLGLTLVKNNTELMKGTISLESEVGKGSAFIVEFPLTETTNVTTEKSIKTLGNNEIEQIKSTPKTNKNILYVEDDKISVQYVTLILKEKYNVDAVATAAKAIEMLKQKEYDLILMDINLSRGMDGVQLTEYIRSSIPEYKDKPIVAATAYAMQSDKEEFLKRGLSGYISKPFAKRDLIALLERVLN
jgi:PAS domain S-box-containing protein